MILIRFQRSGTGRGKSSTAERKVNRDDGSTIAIGAEHFLMLQPIQHQLANQLPPVYLNLPDSDGNVKPVFF